VGKITQHPQHIRDEKNLFTLSSAWLGTLRKMLHGKDSACILDWYPWICFCTHGNTHCSQTYNIGCTRYPSLLFQPI